MVQCAAGHNATGDKGTMTLTYEATQRRHRVDYDSRKDEHARSRYFLIVTRCGLVSRWPLAWSKSKRKDLPCARCRS